MRIHQVGSALGYGDAVTNHMLALDRLLRGWGLATALYGHTVEPRLGEVAAPDTAYRDDDPSDLLIYHYSVYCPNIDLFRRSRHRKLLIYHNITPAHFYTPYHEELERLCQRGRDALPLLRECELGVGVSEYNRRELVEAGFAPDRTAVLPILLDLDAFSSTRRDEKVFRRLSQSAGANLLFVGRGAPNKAHGDLLKLLAAYRQSVDPHAHLWLVGSRFLPRYDAVLDRLAQRLGVADAVTFTDRVSLAELKAYYAGASVFVCASQHEGLCVPLLEAMVFGVPILARAAAAVPDTLGASGVLYHTADYGVLAETVGVLVGDEGLRGQVVAGQRRRLADFAPHRVAAQWRATLLALGIPIGDEVRV
ncbi:MAG: glycosyltransferase family 4 protein [Anaerolineae bacterium]|nr:glycosyltransferase family 4 protein [Anaerolineae bacterium]